MRAVEIDIDKANEPGAIAEAIRKNELKRGDKLIIASGSFDNVNLATAVFAMVVLLLVDYFGKEEDSGVTTDFDKLLWDSLKQENVVQQLGTGVKQAFDIDLELKYDSERKHWYRLSGAGLLKAYADDEPEYALNMLQEPNPAYGK
jgi:hypothetical protein